MIPVEQIMRDAILYDGKDARRIQHFQKVYCFAKVIGQGEKLAARDQYILEVAAVLHDIGIHASEEQYQDTSGKHQELLGPPIARNILEREGVQPDLIDRICYLIGHHHTYENVDGVDYQILIEADFFVNAYEDALSQQAKQKMFEKIFRTETGKALFLSMYDTNDQG